MTTEEMAVQAIARAAEFSDSFPQTRKLIWRRASVRQQQLYQAAAEINPEWGGTEVDATLSSGGCDLNLMPSQTPPVPEVAKLTRVEILDEGASSYSAGDEVAVVRLGYANMESAPRCTIRDGVLQGVGTDLNNVTSLKLFYAQIPEEIDTATEDGTTVFELRDPHSELLVIDGTKQLVKKAMDIEPEKRTIILRALDAEEKEAMEFFMRHVRGRVAEIAGRF